MKDVSKVVLYIIANFLKKVSASEIVLTAACEGVKAVFDLTNHCQHNAIMRFFFFLKKRGGGSIVVPCARLSSRSSDQRSVTLG